MAERTIKRTEREVVGNDSSLFTQVERTFIKKFDATFTKLEEKLLKSEQEAELRLLEQSNLAALEIEKTIDRLKNDNKAVVLPRNIVLGVAALLLFFQFAIFGYISSMQSDLEALKTVLILQEKQP